jgi:hypothetical protein
LKRRLSKAEDGQITMSGVDAHTHAFPDDLAERAIATLEAECPWKAPGDGTVAGLLASMDAADLDVSLVCAIATKPDQVKGIFKWCKSIRSDRIDPLPSIHPDTDKKGKWMERFAKEGFVGIKLHPMYQDFPLDDDRMDELYAAAEETGLIVSPHCGQDIAFPPEDDRASPLRLRRVIDRYPQLKVLCTHLGGWKSWDAVEQHLIGTGVYMETSFTMSYLPPERLVEMIRRHGVDNVLFGTDWPWARQDTEVTALHKLPLTREERHQILSANAAKLLGY